MDTFIIHTPTGLLTAPYNGRGTFIPYPATPPEGMMQIDASRLDLEDIKNAIFHVDTDTALDNLERLGADVRLDDCGLRRRGSDNQQHAHA